MNALLKILFLTLLIFTSACGSSDSANSPKGDGQDVNITSSGEGNTVTVTISNTQNDLSAIEDLINSVTSEEDRVAACNTCVENFEEDLECSCLERLGCQASDMTINNLEDLAICQEGEEEEVVA